MIQILFSTFLGLLFIFSSPGFAATRAERPVRQSRVEAGSLRVQVDVTSIKVKKAEDLKIKMTLTNISKKPLRLNDLALNYPQLVLKVQNDKGEKIQPGPPPTPAANDERKPFELKPKQSKTFLYKGKDFFASEVTPGKYKLSFRYENFKDPANVWTGFVETKALDFEIK